MHALLVLLIQLLKVSKMRENTWEIGGLKPVPLLVVLLSLLMCLFFTVFGSVYACSSSIGGLTATFYCVCSFKLIGRAYVCSSIGALVSLFNVFVVFKFWQSIMLFHYWWHYCHALMCLLFHRIDR